MEPQLLDLREERCPRALLLAKRHVMTLSQDEVAKIYVIEHGSLKDIERYLQSSGYDYQKVALDDYWSIENIARPCPKV